jgi:hypothetical protein
LSAELAAAWPEVKFHVEVTNKYLKRGEPVNPGEDELFRVDYFNGPLRLHVLAKVNGRTKICGRHPTVGALL